MSHCEPHEAHPDMPVPRTDAPKLVGPVVGAREAVRANLEANGVSIAQWARSNKFSRQVVSDLLFGRVQGKRGEAHRAAVALGLKADPQRTSLANGTADEQSAGFRCEEERATYDVTGYSLAADLRALAAKAEAI